MPRRLKPENQHSTVRVSKTFLDHVRIASALCGMTQTQFCDSILDDYVRLTTRRLLASGAHPASYGQIMKAVKQGKTSTKE